MSIGTLDHLDPEVLIGKELLLASKEGMSEYIRLDFTDDTAYTIEPSRSGIFSSDGAILTDIEVFSGVSKNGTALISHENASDDMCYHKAGCGTAHIVTSAEYVLIEDKFKALAMKFDNGVEVVVKAVLSAWDSPTYYSFESVTLRQIKKPIS